jgi:lysine biosynthesis protein LysW
MVATKTWECVECGHIHRGQKAPRRCPSCGAPVESFEPYESDEDEARENTAECPECDAWVELPKNIRLGKKLKCPECETMLEIVELDPPVLDYAFVTEEDS